jgi:hypothetical protein
MEQAKKLHEPVFDHNGKPFSPAQILALERAELTRIRVMRNAMILAERREQLIEMDLGHSTGGSDLCGGPSEALSDPPHPGPSTSGC